MAGDNNFSGKYYITDCKDVDEEGGAKCTRITLVNGNDNPVLVLDKEAFRERVKEYFGFE